MALKRIKLASFEAEILGILKDYEGDITLGLKEGVTLAAKEGTKAIKKESQQFDKNHHGEKGRYYTGWTNWIDTGRLSTQGVIYNQKYPGLVHLLENGHALRQGGRTDAFIHVEDVNDYVQSQFAAAVEKWIASGGKSIATYFVNWR